MALFQPTNIYPSTFGGLGNGTVDITQDLTVFWQVNGTSAMTAFSITIYKNDIDSTQVYTTGKHTEGCPFYGTDYNGETQFFSYTIAASALSLAGMENGNTYKLAIEQWWSESDSLTQTASAAFLTRDAPTLTLDAIPSPVSSRSHTFSAAYAQAQGDAIMWFRWYIQEAQRYGEVLLDTGNIYGSGDVRVSYDGLFNGNYQIRCTAETVNGVHADTGWVPFTVVYALSSLDGLLQACNKLGGLFLKWPLVQYIPGTGSGDWSIANEVLSLGNGGSVTWDTSNGGALAIEPPFTVVWKGKMAAGTAFTLSGQGHTMQFTLMAKSFALTLDEETLYEREWTPSTALNDWVVVCTPAKISVRLEQPRGGLCPSETLYPSAALYPRTSAPEPAFYEGDIAYDAFTISDVVLSGVQTCDYLWIFNGEPDSMLLAQLMQNTGFTPQRGNQTYFLADFTNGLNAGNLTVADTPPTAVSLYRQEVGKTVLQPVGTVPLSVTQAIDYGVKNQTQYIYYLFPVNETAFVSDPLISDPVTAMYWHWTLIECTADSAGMYHMKNVYSFGLNLDSGGMSNNNAPEVLETFTPYPLIQPKNANFKSGSLTSYIGSVTNGQYTDTTALRNAIMALSSTENDLFLKSRKGDFLHVRLSGAVSAVTLDGSREQAQNMTIPWTEIGDAGGVSILSTPQDSAWPLSRLTTEKEKGDAP